MQPHPSSSRSGKHKWNAGGGLPRYLAGPPLLPALTNTAHKIPTGISSQRSGRQRITRVLRFQQMVVHPFIKKCNVDLFASHQTALLPTYASWKPNPQYSSQIVETEGICLEFSSNFFHSLFTPLFSLRCTPLLPQWWATRILEHWDHCNTQINIGKGGNHTSVSRFVTSIAGATYTDAITLSRLVPPRRVPLFPFQLTCSSAEEGISVRRISSPGRTSLAGTALVTRSSESLSQESCYYRYYTFWVILHPLWETTQCI